MTSGIYPILPSLGHLWSARRRRSPSPISARSLLAEWATSALGSVARPVGLLGVRLAPGRGRPVVMLHGYMMSRASFLLLARRLQRAGLGPVYGFEYWTMGTVNSAAERLGEFVASVCAETGASSVDLIGHSMGGVVARYFATLAGGAERVENLITIGSPHGGAHVSSLGIGRPQRELRPGSPLMQRLEVADIPEGVRPLVIWSRADALVWNRAQAGWRGAEELVFDDLGHVALLYSRRVAREIIARLRDRRA